MIIVVARLRVRPGATRAMLEQVAAMAAESRAEPGNLEYAYLVSPEDDGLMVFVEQWRDRRSLAGHAASAHMALYRAATAPLVVTRRMSVYEATEIAPTSRTPR